ncbi:hypothetical protein GTW51_06360 [Aurantimonas aggregata]|uniref:DUF3563 domain-containing protein n=1 Tax=Aurantimonas aggregata TaxID=2047720 RepID=A0A6L9MFG7_9HYPH|nr:hypothetical protein [Aurantimonas aggregata]NDV86322.1 hypothetical protein [Aurantimonas aggregata]
MTITNTIRGLFRSNHRRDVVRDYLDQSISLADLERRQREIDSGRFRAKNYPF